MPSLRRTTSSPVVRSSPYPSSLSSSSHMLSSGGNRPKRTASDSVTRRVLADIEWWRVFDGQQEEYFVEQASDASRDDTFVLGSALHDHLDMDSLRPSTPVNRDESGGQGYPVVFFSAESTISAIAPSTPSRSRHSRGSSNSSLESTPEPERLHSCLDLTEDNACKPYFIQTRLMALETASSPGLSDHFEDLVCATISL